MTVFHARLLKATLIRQCGLAHALKPHPCSGKPSLQLGPLVCMRAREARSRSSRLQVSLGQGVCHVQNHCKGKSFQADDYNRVLWISADSLRSSSIAHPQSIRKLTEFPLQKTLRPPRTRRLSFQTFPQPICKLYFHSGSLVTYFTFAFLQSCEFNLRAERVGFPFRAACSSPETISRRKRSINCFDPKILPLTPVNSKICGEFLPNPMILKMGTPGGEGVSISKLPRSWHSSWSSRATSPLRHSRDGNLPAARDGISLPSDSGPIAVRPGPRPTMC